MKKIIFFGLLVLFYLDAICCSGFVFNKQNHIYLCANLDQSVMHGYIIANKRNVEKFSFFATSPDILRWTSKHGSITFSSIGKDFPEGGMNEEGLAIAIMTTSEMNYPVKDNRYEINESQWIQYILDNYSTTMEAVNSDSIVRINRFFDNWHYLICDKNGDIAIIEFKNGVRKVYSGNEIEIPVLENSFYEKSLKSYKIEKNKCKLSSRFSEMSFLLDNLDFNKLNLNEPKSMFTILDNVKQDYTKWQIVYDIQNRKIICRTKDFNYLKKYGTKGFMWGGVSETFIDLKSVDFTGETLAKKIGIYNQKETPDKNFLPFNKVFDSELLKFNIEIFKSHGPKNITKKIIENYIQFARKDEFVKN